MSETITSLSVVLPSKAPFLILPTVIVLCVGLVGMVHSTSAWMFLGFYLLWQIMHLMEATEIPLVHYDVVPVEVMGAFSSIRLLCLNLTAVLSGMAVGFSLDRFPSWTVFAVCAALKIVSALLFARGSRLARLRQCGQPRGAARTSGSA